jgi:hypothetical protein
MDSTELKLQRGDTLLIEFSDMSMTFAYVMAADGIQARIKVDGYRTRRGTHIGTKIWMVQRIDPVRDSLCYRVQGFSPEKRTPWKS